MRFNKISLAAMLLGGSMLLAACGGGDNAPSILTVSGTAAKGSPVVGGAVAITCKSGSGTATSNTDGSFKVAISGGVGPCLLSLKPADGTATLYSITSGSSLTQTANITSMTNLLVNYLLNVPGIVATTPEAWFAKPATQQLLTNTAELTTRITNDFIPAIKTLVPTLSLANTSFLSTTFTADPTASTTDADLEKLTAAAVVTSTGTGISAATLTSLKTEAAKDAPVVFVSGAGN